MIINTCPECGADLEHITFTTNPPIQAWNCPKCGFRYEQRETIKRVPFTPQKNLTNYDLLIRKPPEELADLIFFELAQFLDRDSLLAWLREDAKEKSDDKL